MTKKKVKIFSKVEPDNIFRGKGFVLIIKSNFLGHFSVTHRETEKQRNGETDRKVGLQSCLVAAKNEVIKCFFTKKVQLNAFFHMFSGELHHY